MLRPHACEGFDKLQVSRVSYHKPNGFLQLLLGAGLGGLIQSRQGGSTGWC